MGLSNSICTKEDLKCPKCSKSLRFDTDNPVYHNIISFQSKDMFTRGYCWNVGDKINFEDGGMTFVSEDNTIWDGCHICPHCNMLIDCKIIIEKGTIARIEIQQINEGEK